MAFLATFLPTLPPLPPNLVSQERVKIYDFLLSLVLKTDTSRVHLSTLGVPLQGVEGGFPKSHLRLRSDSLKESRYANSPLKRGMDFISDEI